MNSFKDYVDQKLERENKQARDEEENRCDQCGQILCQCDREG